VQTVGTMGRGGQKAEASNVTQPLVKEQKAVKTWENVVRIDGVEYDVTEFMRRHPGGSVIKYGLANSGADATALYNAFHQRSKKADKILKTLPKRTPECELQPGQLPGEGDKEAEMLRDFVEFEKELHEEGFFTPSAFHRFYRITELALLFALGLYLYTLRTPLAIAAGIAVHGLFGARCGWVQHECGHGSFYESIWLGKRVQAFFIGFGLGTSGDMWCMMHNKHHAATQKVNHDLDLDTTPLVAFFNTAFEKNRHASGFSKFWMRFQALTFLPVTSGTFVMLFWLLFLHPRRVITHGKWDEGFWMISSHVVRTALFQYCTGWENLAACYLIGFWGSMWVSGMYLFGHFSLSHTHLDVIEEDVHKNWVRYAVDHTVDISPGNPVVCWLMGYLNLQVLHHLFPAMPQHKQVEVSRRFKVFADKHGLNYRTMGYFEAWSEMFGNLFNVGKHYSEHGVQSKPVKSE